MLRRAVCVSVTVEAHGLALSHQMTSRCAWCGIREHRPIKRVHARAGDPDRAQPEREHRVLGIAGVVDRRAVGRHDREVRLTVELVVQLLEERPDTVAYLVYKLGKEQAVDWMRRRLLIEELQ